MGCPWTSPLHEVARMNDVLDEAVSNGEPLEDNDGILTRPHGAPTLPHRDLGSGGSGVPERPLVFRIRSRDRTAFATTVGPYSGDDALDRSSFSSLSLQSYSKYRTSTSPLWAVSQDLSGSSMYGVKNFRAPPWRAKSASNQLNTALSVTTRFERSISIPFRGSESHRLRESSS